MTSQVPSAPFGGGDDYLTLLRKARQSKAGKAQSTLMDLVGLTDSQRKALKDGQSLTDRFEMELDARQKALEDVRRARLQQTSNDRRKADQAEAARKLEKARKEMERLKQQAQAAAASGDVERARSIAQAVKGVLRDISAALRTLHSAAATSFLSGALEKGGGVGSPTVASGAAATGATVAGPADAGGAAPSSGTPAASPPAASPPAGQAADGSAPAGMQADTGALAAKDLNGDGTVDAQDRDAARKQQDQVVSAANRGAGIDPVLIEAQGEAGKAVAIARQIVAILRSLRPRPQDREPDAAETTRNPAAEGGATPPQTPPTAPPGRDHRRVVETLSAEVEGVALGLAITSGQTVNIQA